MGTWGILFSASAYLPLSPEYPDERIRYMVEDSRIKVILAQENLYKKLRTLAPEKMIIITLDDVIEFSIAECNIGRHHIGRELGQRDLAYIIYTSGSTGKPKGVMIEHRSIVNQMNWLKQTFGLGAGAAVLQKTPMSFDAAQWEILSPAIGCTVVMGAPGIYRDPGALIETINRHKVTTLQCVPTLLKALLHTDGFESCKTLTKIFSGGEILANNLASQCYATLPSCQLVNLYGPTECTINASAHIVEKTSFSSESGSVPIGVPAHNTRFYILDENRNKVAPGEVAELYIGGEQLARGYLHKPEMTAEKFIDNPFEQHAVDSRLYKTGDLAYWNPEGTVQYVGRNDSQVKLRGFRVELNEIRLAIEDHSWVENAVILAKYDAKTGFQNLIACIELDEKEAALMDQGNHGTHHQSKSDRLQVKAQLSNAGCRDEAEVEGKVIIELAGRTASEAQRKKVFARKTYRFFEGGPVTCNDLLQLLEPKQYNAQASRIEEVGFSWFGKLLRYFGQFVSFERLLPKYGYASPGALYATQMYFEFHNVFGLCDGYYYYDPVHHTLVMINEAAQETEPGISIHFMGKKRAIVPVYRNNILEVLEIEAGHMLGLLDEVLPDYGLAVGEGKYTPAVANQLECADEDYYLGSFGLVPFGSHRHDDQVKLYVQAHPGKIEDLPAGMYQYNGAGLERIADDLIMMKHVIAINQGVYENAVFGVAIVRAGGLDWCHYISLGRTLQRLQQNGLNIGLMSSGYTSKSGNDLPSAKRMAQILDDCGQELTSFYFCIGGRISDEQRLSVGMKEDTVHMKGPVEMIKDDLANSLPQYMVPNKIVLFDEMPLTPNGKIDQKALLASDGVNEEVSDRPCIAARTHTEERLARIWQKVMKQEAVSVQSNFFELGGNSLTAIAIINAVNNVFEISLPLQVMFETPTIEALARTIDSVDETNICRLIKLSDKGSQPPIYCWPGLGGYPMNLRTLAGAMCEERPFYGVQAYGINPGETPYPTIMQMAAADVSEIKRIQPTGPYTLWGYSFGARVAFEAAYQLEQQGERVEHLYLIAPGSPKLHARVEAESGTEPGYQNKAFVTILYSVFAQCIRGPELEECLALCKDEERFINFVCAGNDQLDKELVKRIVDVVTLTYEFKYTFCELNERQVKAPITIFKAKGDDYSFLENCKGYSTTVAKMLKLDSDHYTLLKEVGVKDLIDNMERIRAAKIDTPL